VLGGISPDLGAMQHDMAQAHHAGLLTQPQDLDKQALEGIQVAGAKLADPAAKDGTTWTSACPIFPP
jgi:hypothetical protein